MYFCRAHFPMSRAADSRRLLWCRRLHRAARMAKGGRVELYVPRTWQLVQVPFETKGR